MKWLALIANPKPMKFIIEPETYTDVTGKIQETHYKLSIYENDKGIEDDLQDTLEWAMAVAEEDYGVPRTAWKQVNE